MLGFTRYQLSPSFLFPHGQSWSGSAPPKPEASQSTPLVMEKVSKPDAYDLKVAWQNACDAFATTSGEKLNVKTQYTPDEVLEQIRKKHEKDEEKAAKYRVVKDVLSKTLDCIDNLGNIAAQGASMASVLVHEKNHVLTKRRYLVRQDLLEMHSHISLRLVQSTSISLTVSRNCLPRSQTSWRDSRSTFACLM